MRNAIALPLLGLAVIVQSSIVGQFPLLGGTADLVLVLVTAWALQESVATGFQWAFLASILVSIVSGLPWFIYGTAYGVIVILSLLLQRRVWQVPMLAMFTVTFLGTAVLHLLTLAYLDFTGSAVPLNAAFGAVTLPSVLLNMVIAIPAFGLMRDLAAWVYPGAQA